ncbi:uncharacterized protein Dana_GF13940 [Drosophila ananassae]|uniref:Uncharacterized protein n=1 Tax=Drosophila ananassae TaxID=7217 RepID=A0A0P8XWS3_DROAN|nr:uncharacterized protein Dana_GF13940 [Drosophila ananassae]
MEPPNNNLAIASVYSCDESQLSPLMLGVLNDHNFGERSTPNGNETNDQIAKTQGGSHGQQSELLVQPPTEPVKVKKPKKKRLHKVLRHCRYFEQRMKKRLAGICKVVASIIGHMSPSMNVKPLLDFGSEMATEMPSSSCSDSENEDNDDGTLHPRLFLQNRDMCPGSRHERHSLNFLADSIRVVVETSLNSLQSLANS